MVLTLEVPDDIAQALSGAGHADPQRFALQAVAAEGYRKNRLTQKQVGEVLGLSRIQAEDFLACHADPDEYEPDRLAREAESLRRYSESRNR